MTTAPLGVDELGTLLRHTPDWVRAQCRAGRLPHHKIGKFYLFTPEDVAQIFESTAVETRPAPPQPLPAVRRRRYPTYHRTSSSRNDSAQPTCVDATQPEDAE